MLFRSPSVFVTGTFSGALMVTGALTPSGGIKGKTDGAAVAQGYVGEMLPFTARDVVNTGAVGYYSNTSALVTLTAGTWILYPRCNVPANSVQFSTFVSTNSTPGLSGIIGGGDYPAFSQATYGQILSIFTVGISTTGTAVYAQIRCYVTDTMTTSISGFAVRIA